MQAALDSRTATVGFNPAVPGGIAPLGVPGTRPPTTEDIQAFVERLGFRRVETWSDASFGDSFAGLKYQYFQLGTLAARRDRPRAVPDGALG